MQNNSVIVKVIFRITLIALGMFSFKSYSQTYNFVYDGVTRSYIVHLPTGYTSSTQYPVVLDIHGFSSNASQQQSISHMDVVADTAKFIVVYPNGVNNAWNCGAYGFNTTVNDVGFISALIDTVKKNYSVNTNKIFSCGLSLGGFMSYRIACNLSNKIAAIASVAGLLADTVALTCQSNCPVPVMHFHGTTDGIVSYNGGTDFLSVDSTIKFWIAKNSCPKTPVVTNIPDVNTTDGCTVTKYYYGPGSNSSEVVFFKITGGGHTWPSGTPLPTGATNMDIDASGEIWKFFRNKSLLCGVNGVDESSDARLQFSVSPNPSNGKFKVESSEPKVQRIEVINLLGEVIYQSSNIQNAVDISDAPNGIYFVKIKTENEVSTQKIVKQ